MIHPDTEPRLISREFGWGVFSLRPLPRGTVTWVLGEDDAPLPGRGIPADWLDATLPRERTDPEDRFLYQNQEGRLILLGDHARFVNHACDPNTAGGRDDRFSIALRDIAAGEQLTEDYGELAAFQPFSCGCGAPRCRGRIRPLLGRERLIHQRQVDLALEAMCSVPQRLRIPGVVAQPRGMPRA